MTERLEKQLAFILEADKSKQVFRQTYISDGSRKETTRSIPGISL